MMTLPDDSADEPDTRVAPLAFGRAHATARNAIHAALDAHALPDVVAGRIAAFGAQFVSATGRPASPMRLVAGLPYLKHACALDTAHR